MVHSDCQISVNTRKKYSYIKKNFFLIYYVRNSCMLVLTRRNFLFSAICWKILIKGIFYLELKSDNVNTDKFSLTIILLLFHSGNNISYGGQHKAARYKNIFLWSWNDKSKSPLHYSQLILQKKLSNYHSFLLPRWVVIVGQLFSLPSLFVPL